jgi:hypothetical protein
MAKHVFVGVATSTAADFALNVSGTFAGPAGIIGIWNPDQGTGGDYLAGTGTELFVTGANALAAGMSRFQLVQGTTSGYPHGTGLLETMRVKSVTSQMYLAGAKAANAEATISNSASLNNSTWGLKIVQRAGSSNYEDSINPSGDSYDRVGRIQSYEFVTDASGSVAEIATGLVAAINADTSAIVTATNSATGKILITAKEYGIGFQVIDTSATAITVSAGTLVGTYGATEGCGNGWQAVQAEKKARHHKGAHHNRIHFAKPGPELFAVATGTYDVITITCDGGIRQDATNAMDDQVIQLYLPSGWTDAGAGVIEDHFEGLASASAAGLKQNLYTK